MGRPAACHRSGCRKLGLLGLIAGVLGKLIMPGRDPGGFIVTIPLGWMAEAVVGFLGGTGATGFNTWSILVATLGAIVLLALYRLIAALFTLLPRVGLVGHLAFRHTVPGTRASGNALEGPGVDAPAPFA